MFGRHFNLKQFTEHWRYKMYKFLLSLNRIHNLGIAITVLCYLSCKNTLTHLFYCKFCNFSTSLMDWVSSFSKAFIKLIHTGNSLVWESLIFKITSSYKINFMWFNLQWLHRYCLCAAQKKDVFLPLFIFCGLFTSLSI